MSGNIEQTLANLSAMWLIFKDDFHDFEAYRRCPLESIFLHRLEKNERTLSALNLSLLPIALYLNLFKVSVRYRFPAQAQQKCDLTYTKRHFIPMWFEALLEVSVRVHFHAQARGN